jgi:hypothetical protein
VDFSDVENFGPGWADGDCWAYWGLAVMWWCEGACNWATTPCSDRGDHHLRLDIENAQPLASLTNSSEAGREAA